MKKKKAKSELKVGRIYYFKIAKTENYDDYLSREITKKAMRCLKKYENFALFESDKGIRECFSYWQIGKMLRGEKIS